METNWHTWSTKRGLLKQKINLNNTSVLHRKHVLYRWKETKREEERDGEGKTKRGGVNTWSEHAFTNMRRRILIIEYQNFFECTEYSNIRCSPRIETNNRLRSAPELWWQQQSWVSNSLRIKQVLKILQFQHCFSWMVCSIYQSMLQFLDSLLLNMHLSPCVKNWWIWWES